jgi:hypothetical protein
MFNTPQPWNPRYIQINPDVSGYRYIRICIDTSGIYPDLSGIHPDVSRYIWDTSGYIEIHTGYIRYVYIRIHLDLSGYICIYLDISEVPRLGGTNGFQSSHEDQFVVLKTFKDSS